MENPLKLSLWLLLLSCVVWSLKVGAEEKLHNPALIRKVVVFPMNADKGLGGSTDEAWWKVRETITDTKRFQVASKRFMIQKDVFQARGSLQPADAILLGQLLDGDALITLQYKNRELQMAAYSRVDGSLLWTQKANLHPSVPAEEQISEVAVKLIRDFIASIPYHGVQILDPLVNRPVYEEGDVKVARVDVGTTTRAQEGDPVQWISVQRAQASSLFNGGGIIEVIAEGQILKNDNGILIVEIKRSRAIEALKVDSFVRLPKEAEFLKGWIMQSSRNPAPELRYAPLPPTRSEKEESKPLATALITIVSFIGFILLAL